MPALDFVDEIFILAPLSELRATACGDDAWKARGMALHCYEDRGDKGKRWTLSGDLTGTAEVWLEPAFDGVIVHVYIRADPKRRVSCARMQSPYAHPIKRWILDIKSGYDSARPAGLTSFARGKISVHAESAQTEPNETVPLNAAPMSAVPMSEESA